MRQDIEKLGSFFNISPFFILLPHRMFAVTLKKNFPETSKEVMKRDMSLDSRLGDTHSNKRNISNVMIGEESFVPWIAAFSFLLQAFIYEKWPTNRWGQD